MQIVLLLFAIIGGLIIVAGCFFVIRPNGSEANLLICDGGICNGCNSGCHACIGQNPACFLIAVVMFGFCGVVIFVQGVIELLEHLIRSHVHRLYEESVPKERVDDSSFV